jgi:adenylate kinase family enzyme
MVIGGPGSGKTTLALELGARLGLPVVHFDTLRAQLPLGPDRADILRTAMARHEAADHWVIDGLYLQSLPNRVERADIIVWLDIPLVIRLWRVTVRSFRFWGRNRPGLPPEATERPGLSFYRFMFQSARRSERRIRNLAPTWSREKLVHLTSAAEVRAWLDRTALSCR